VRIASNLMETAWRCQELGSANRTLSTYPLARMESQERSTE
jgi:hypothetical protein